MTKVHGSHTDSDDSLSSDSSSESSSSDSENEVEQFKKNTSFKDVIVSNQHIFDKIKNVQSENKLISILDHCKREPLNAFVKMIDGVICGKHIRRKYLKREKFVKNLQKHTDTFKKTHNTGKRLTKGEALRKLKFILEKTNVKTFKSLFHAYGQ